MEPSYVGRYEVAARKSFPSRLAEPKLQRRLGDGAFKGVVVFPIREIGDVVFADLFRQIFAGVDMLDVSKKRDFISVWQNAFIPKLFGSCFLI